MTALGIEYRLIPGFSQTARAWDEVIASLPESVSGGAFDIPDRTSFLETADALSAADRGIWAGYSMGGRLALQIALTSPGIVSALVLISVNPGIEDPAARRDRRRTDGNLAAYVETAGIEPFLDRWLAQPMFAHLEKARLNRLDSSDAIAHQLRTLGQGACEPVWDRLGELAMPVAVIAGDRDEKYSGIARRTAAAIGPNAGLHIIPGAGHALLQEAPAAVAAILSALLRQ